MRNKKRSFEERLRDHSYLRERFSQLLDIVEDTDGDLDRADEAERRVVEELRQLGGEILGNWAVSKENQKIKEIRRTEDRKLTGHGKKNSIGRRRSER